MSVAPGLRLGACEIVAPPGAGGMGEVYRAIDTRLGRDVAIKHGARTEELEDRKIGRLADYAIRYGIR